MHSRLWLCMCLTVGAAGCGNDRAEASVAQQASPAGRSGTVAADSARATLSSDERKFYTDMARASWIYLDRNYQKSSGLVNARPAWPYTTMWDLGAQILGYHAAKELGLVSQEQVDEP